MATSTVPFGNPAGVNQANPALKNSSIIGSTTTSLNPIPGGSVPAASNPYIMGAGTTPGATSSGSVPSSSSGSPLPSKFTYTDPSVLPGTDPGQQQLLQKQFVDIAGKGTGGQLAQQYAGMAGTDSAIFEQWMKGQQPVWAQQKADFGQTMGAAGISPNSTVEALGLTNLESNQAAQAGAMNARLMEHNQQNQLGILQEMLKPSIQEVASSGWDVFGNVMNAISSVEGAALGMPKMFQKQGSPSGDIYTSAGANPNAAEAGVSGIFGTTV